jgi:hypothetical protein
LEELEHVMCRVVARISSEEKAALQISRLEKSWPWFKIRDENIMFDLQQSRWFLAGRAIASYECR